ncbi:hypothetical protein ACLOJK_022816 [Asimina triloba]
MVQITHQTEVIWEFVENADEQAFRPSVTHTRRRVDYDTTEANTRFASLAFFAFAFASLLSVSAAAAASAPFSIPYYMHACMQSQIPIPIPIPIMVFLSFPSLPFPAL